MVYNRRPPFDVPIAEFAFDRGITSVVRMQNNIRFQSVVAAVIRNLAAKCLLVNLQIPNAHASQDKTECLQIRFEAVRQGSHRCDCNRRINEAALLRLFIAVAD